MQKAINNVQFADVEALKKRFLLINRERLRRGEDCMRASQRDFLDFLPLLFHINHPRLPGYTSKDAPAGICDYSPNKRALQAANKYISRFDYKKKAMPRYDIISMFLMGSSGTVAYSRSSDFDIWLCHQHDLRPEQLAELQTKCTAIEEWADSKGLEVHFFLMDAERFRQGEIVDLSSESSGTAQYYLLLEEFYRTSLLIAGRYPAWWLVPAEHESNYDAYLQGLYDRRIISEGECIDFGGIPTVPAEEFFGAALWQLFKGIDSPYKSVLKLLLMEVYASAYPNIQLLCLHYKQAIHAGENDLDRLDPYIMLYRQLEEYLLKRDEEERLELVRRCFYIKVNQRLSHPEPRDFDWRRNVLSNMISAWGWEEHQLELMDNRANWKILHVQNERGVLVKELTYTYQFLSDFGREHAQLAAINQQDLNALGRKLYAAFERKSGKVEIINRGISENVQERQLAFYQIKQKADNGGWAVLSGGEHGESETSAMTPLKRTRHLIEALAWSHFNGLMSSNTMLKAVCQRSDCTAQELIEASRALEKIMPREQLLKTNIEALGRAVSIINTAIIVNFGNDPHMQSRRVGQHLASNRTDALSYGGMSENLIASMDQIVINSWKEVIVTHHEGIDGILQCISSYLRWMPPTRGNMPPTPEILCFSTQHTVTIRQRIERLFKDVLACFYGSPEAINNRFIFCIERYFFVLYFEDDVLRFQRLPGHSELLRHLSKGRHKFGKVIIDEQALQDTVLPLIYKLNKPDVVQLFFREENSQADIYIVDKHGSMFYQRSNFLDTQHLLGQYKRFFDSTLQRQLFQIGTSIDTPQENDVEYYRISRDSHGRWQVGRCDAQHASPRAYFNIQVLAEEQDDGSNTFRVFCEDQEFSSLEHGGQMFHEAARYIMQQRASGQSYPIFITDIDLPSSMFGEYADGNPPLVEFLNYKRTIEGRLNAALDELAREAKVRNIRPSGPS